MTELWEWPCKPEIDKHGIALVWVPEKVRPVDAGYRVHLILPDGKRLRGVVVESSRNAWIARVRLDDGQQVS